MSNVKDNFQLFIALPTDGVCTIRELSRQMFVYELKSRVELKAGIPGDIFSFFFMNVQLQDKETLKAYNLKNGCIVRVKVESNWVGLFEACWNGDIFDVFENGVQFLDEEKFPEHDISLWNKLVIQRATLALFIACHRGYLGLILELINRAATDINGTTLFGRGALHAAAYQGFVGCVSLLLSEGAVPNQIDIQGKTALALASENGHVHCERRLWLYQMNLSPSAGPSTSCSVGSHEISGASCYVSPIAEKKDRPDLNNNYNDNQYQTERPTGVHSRPRFTLKDNKRQRRQFTNSTSHESSKSASKRCPLMQIAEKYKKELREYNEGTLILLPSENRLAAENERLGHAVQATNLEANSEGEAKAVVESNTLKETEITSMERSISSSGETKVPDDKAEDNKTPSDWLTKTQALNEQGRGGGEKGKQDHDRLFSGRENAARKLEIAMTESRLERLNVVSSSRGQDTEPFDHPISENEAAQKEEISLADIRREYCYRKPGQTFESWLQMKRHQGKNRPCTAPAQKSKMGKSLEPEFFKKWLNSKRHQRTNSSSDSSSKSKKTFISSGGMTFDRWLETKSANRPLSAINYVTESRDSSQGVNKVRKPVICGKPFELWLAEKKAMEQSIHDEENEEESKNHPRCGKTFEVWLQDKHKQRQIELVQKITTLKEQKRLAKLDQLRKWLNPRYKTFDDWLAIKNHQALLERNRTHAQNESIKQQEDVPADEKQKDAKIVYNIWQTMKALKELSDEELKYKEMKTLWAAKEKEKKQPRRLNVVRTRRFKLNST